VMTSICEELAELLGTVRQPGDFFAFGRILLSLPRLDGSCRAFLA
jgi:hypothetical protein